MIRAWFGCTVISGMGTPERWRFDAALIAGYHLERRGAGVRARLDFGDGMTPTLVEMTLDDAREFVELLGDEGRWTDAMISLAAEARP